MNLQRLIEQYISFQRSLGSSFISDAAILRAFGRARGPRASVASVRVRHVDAFLGKARPVTRTWFGKLSCLRCFFRYAVSRGYVTTAPLPDSNAEAPAGIRSLHLHAGRNPPPSPSDRVPSAWQAASWSQRRSAR